MIGKILASSFIPRTRSQISLQVGLPENFSGRVRSFLHPTSSSPWLSTLTNHAGDEQ
jgi:hypothetical protein